MPNSHPAWPGSWRPVATTSSPARSYRTAKQTSDAEIARSGDDEDRVVITKDSAFRDGHLLRSTPRRLLIVATATAATTTSSRCSASIPRKYGSREATVFRNLHP